MGGGGGLTVKTANLNKQFPTRNIHTSGIDYDYSLLYIRI